VSADRNLLFGVLALQAGLIDNDQFARAWALWAAQKDAPLADVLVAQGWLTAEDRSHVDYLLQRKLHRHQGDARASLAAVTTDEARRALAGVADPQVRQSLAALPTPTSPALGATTAYQPQRRGRYTLTRLHAEGGIGQVWLARDGDLGREVALKELRPERADNPAVCARFLEEAKVTGQLEHPGIVPVYELATPADGQKSFYTMRFVGGRTLADTIKSYHRGRQAGAAGPLELRELLGAFVGVCNAVAYAHSRGVIHRDLKPQNVALGDFGEAMVLDWGLARVLDGADERTSLLPVTVPQEGRREQTIQGQVLGTPAYMPPEQAQGRWDRIGPASDVYGLGAILYEVLTSHAPFTGTDTQEVLKQVVQQPPLPPHQQVPKTATPPPGTSPSLRALEAICLKALAKQPEDRYASARDLADDVRRWLADEPVSAYPDPWAVRARRWVGRHRTLVTSLVAAVVVAAVSLAASMLLLVAANDLLRRERDRADVARREAAASAAEARQQRDEVQRQRDATAGAFFRLARMTAARASKAEAAKVYEQTLGLFEALARDHPMATTYLADLAATHHNLGNVYHEMGQWGRAEAASRKALAIREQLDRDRPSPQAAVNRASTYHSLGNVYSATGRKGEAEAAYRKALAIQGPLAHDHPAAAEYQNQLAGCLNDLAHHYHRTGNRGRAEETFRRALDIRKKLIDEHPGAPQYRADQAKGLISLGVLHIETGRRDRAEATFREALTLLGKLAREHPAVTEYQSQLATSYNNLGNLHVVAGRRDRAEAAYRKALALRERLAEENPGVLENQNDVATSHMNLGMFYQGTAQRERAEVSFGKALGLLERLARENPAIPRYQNELAACHNSLGILQAMAGRRERAEAAYRRALGIREELVRRHPSNASFAAELAGTYCNLGHLLSGAPGWKDRPGAALDSYGRSIQALEAALRRDRRDAVAREFLTNAYSGRAEALQQLGRDAEAAHDWGRACELDTGAGRAAFRHRRAAALARSGDHAGAAGEANRVAAGAKAGGAVLYAAARVLAQAASVARRDARRAEIDRNPLAEQYAARAVELLRQAVARGYKDVAHLKHDKELEALRTRADFQKLLAELK
jgi:serine/threonine-protein kinase